MTNDLTDRGFQVVTHPGYGGEVPLRLVQQSSAVGDYPDAVDRPGSSALWVGISHHLDREQVAELAKVLVHWLATGDLFAAPVAPLPPSAPPAGACSAVG